MNLLIRFLGDNEVLVTSVLIPIIIGIWKTYNKNKEGFNKCNTALEYYKYENMLLKRQLDFVLNFRR